MSTIEALHIFDEHNNLILKHVYTGRPSLPSTLLASYLQQPAPRSSVMHLPFTNPPSLLHAMIQDNLLFLSPCSSDVEPLLVLEFLHRTADALEEFLGSPLLASRISVNYDVVSQIASEMADAGVVCQSEANALRDVVETGPGVLNNILGKVGLPGNSPAAHSMNSGSGIQRPTVLQPAQTAQGSAVPWRRSNVKHTSNELYVDIVETLSVTLAPSGRPLAAFAYGSVAFTSKVSGVPDLLLSLSTGGKGAGMGNRGDQLRGVMEQVVFHPCIRLNRWKSDGVLSFVPPDGRFALCGYEVDLLGPEASLSTEKTSATKLDLPALIEINTGLGTSSTDFEVRLTQPPGGRSAATASLHSNLGRPGPFKAASTGDSKSPALENITIRVPIPSLVRNVSELRPSRGEARWDPVNSVVEWKVPSRELGPGTAVLRCTVQGPVSDADEGDGGTISDGMTSTTYDYDNEQESTSRSTKAVSSNSNGNHTASQAASRNRELMPTSATLSFGLKGWLASGLKVESLLVDTKKSRGLGAEVKPYKGVKYLTVSRDGIEVRC